MATCPHCASMVEAEAERCWQCEGEIPAGEPSAGELPVVDRAGDPDSAAPTLHAGSSSARAATDTMIGREILGQYVLLSKLGEGGMGEVYLADQPAIGRQVAIKVVHAHARERDQDELAERFRNEAKAAARLQSPHIVSIFNWGELDDGVLFMAMEYLDGLTLREYLQRHAPLTPEDAVDIATQICAALAEAHSSGIVHRDLKPSNIMFVERRGEQPGEMVRIAKVLDFGVAKLEGADITRSGALFGTPQYMSPEQLRSKRADGRSDLYSLGVMLYEMLAGELPFDSPTALGFVTAHLHEVPPTLSQGVPRALAEVVEHLMAKDPDERLPDADAVAVELWDALGGRPTAARRRARRRAARSSLSLALWVGLGLGVLGAGSFAGWRLWTWSGETQAALEAERREAAALRRQVDAQTAALEDARVRAHAAALDSHDAALETRVERDAVHRGAPRAGGQVDPQTRRMLGRSKSELEQTLYEVLSARRVPPSEVADVLAQLERGAPGGDNEGVREELVALILLYRRNFKVLEAGDELGARVLERAFLEMAGPLPAAERQVALARTRAEYEGDVDLDPEDRLYFERLAIAALVREQAGQDEGALAAALALGARLPGPEPEPEPEPEPWVEADAGSSKPELPDPEPDPPEPGAGSEGAEFGGQEAGAGSSPADDPVSAGDLGGLPGLED